MLKIWIKGTVLCKWSYVDEIQFINNQKLKT